MKNAYVLLLITLAGSAQAITWAEYYAAHQAAVNEAVVTAPHYLDLTNRGLTDLNGFDAIPGLNTLQRLWLNNNQLGELPPTIFQGLNALQLLSLDNNQLREIPPSIFQGLNALRTLYLAENQLRELPLSIFRGLNALQQLYLNGNQLRELPPTIFRGLNALQGLSLHNNQLRDLPPTVFQGLNALQRISLSNNQLKDLPPTIFQTLDELQWLYLENNRIPGTNAKLKAALQLPNFLRAASQSPFNINLRFKTPDQEQAEALFAAIGQSNVATVRQLITERIRNPQVAAIPVSALRDYDGNNLLHAAIISAARHLASIAGKSHNVQGSEEEKDAQRAKLAKDKSIINARYVKLIDAILACGEQCAQEMLATPNTEGQDVVKAAITKLGLHNSPITEALLKLGLPEVNVKAKLESYGSAARQRL